MTRIVVAATPVPGHATPLRTIAVDLARREHEVVLMTGSQFKASVGDAGLRFAGLSSIADYPRSRQAEIFEQRSVLPPGPEQLNFDFTKVLYEAVPDQHTTLQRILAEAPDEPTVVLTAPSFMGQWPVRLGTPGVRPAGYAGIGVVPLPLTSVDTAPDLPPGLRHVSSLPAERPVTDALPSWWSDVEKAKTVIPVTQGTLANRDLGQLVVPTLRALADLDAIVVATTGREAVLAEVPANARVAELLPYPALLPLVDVMTTNGGYGETLQAPKHGVSLVAAGQGEHKIEVFARLAWTGAAVNLATDTPTALRRHRLGRRGNRRPMRDARRGIDPELPGIPDPPQPRTATSGTRRRHSPRGAAARPPGPSPRQPSLHSFTPPRISLQTMGQTHACSLLRDARPRAHPSAVSAGPCFP